MPAVSAAWLGVALMSAAAPAPPGPGAKTEIVETRVIWDGGDHNSCTDLVRFKDRWFAVCREGESAHSADGALRVITSADGVKWEAAALLTAPGLDKGWPDPKLSVTADGRIMLTAAGVIPKTTVRALAWFAKDGRKWAAAEHVGAENQVLGRVHWHKGKAYAYAYGCICGNAQTVFISSGKDGKGLEAAHEHTMSGAFPSAGALVFDGDKAHCLMSRNDGGRSLRPALVGTAKVPYAEWVWKEADARIALPNLLRLPDGRIIAASGLYDGKARTSLCLLDPVAGKLTEVLELPAGGAVGVGLAWHGRHLWVSYHAPRDKKMSVHLAKVKVGAGGRPTSPR